MSDYRNRPHRESSADRIRRRMEKIEDERKQYTRVKLNPFTLVSILIIIALGIFASNIAFNAY